MRQHRRDLVTYMPRAALWGLLASGICGGAVAQPSAGQAASADATAVPVCARCHGTSGEGVDAMHAPRIGGLPAAYLLEQLNAFAEGGRQSEQMSPLARLLTREQRVQQAQLWARQRVPPTAPNPSSDNAADELALQGRWSQGIPACVQCHAGHGVGLFPSLTGQSATYIGRQLHAFKAGTRQGDPLGLMRGITAKLSDADILAVAGYFASQSGTSGSVRIPAQAAVAPKATSDGKGMFQPADVPIADAGFREVVQLGRDVFEDPRKYAAAYVGNDLHCSSCHLNAGRQVGSAPMWAAYVSYPAYRAKNHHVNTFAERLQGCFQYSMNGRAPPLGDPVLVALESYAFWLARGAPVDPNIPGRGYVQPGKPALAPDSARGAALYERKCAQCHGPTGAGQHADAGHVLFPALWGANSYNWGAGMANVPNAAAFIKSNMPFSQGNTLSDQEAWDVAWYVDSRERPQDPRYAGSVAHTRAAYHDSEDSLYGKVVDGYLLGSKAAPPGGHPATTRGAGTR